MLEDETGIEIEIRAERPGDAAGIRRVTTDAFGRPDEAELVDRLRSACPDALSLVAVEGDELVGQILFTEARLADVDGLGLAPMSVASARQRRGLGSRLIRAGLAEAKTRGCPFVIVLGHADYYPRFGFERASLYGIRCKWDVPDEVFMVLRLDTDRMDGVTGVAHYREEFG